MNPKYHNVCRDLDTLDEEYIRIYENDPDDIRLPDLELQINALYELKNELADSPSKSSDSNHIKRIYQHVISMATYMVTSLVLLSLGLLHGITLLVIAVVLSQLIIAIKQLISSNKFSKEPLTPNKDDNSRS